MTKQLIIIAHNIRSTHNVGALLRTADGLGVEKVLLTGYTPYPYQTNDERLPHIASKIHRQIHKTALGAEEFIDWGRYEDIEPVLEDLKKQGYKLAGLEQAPDSQALPDFRAPDKLALILGREVEGIEPSVLKKLDIILEIPMKGKKESFNVVEAASMAAYHCLYML